MVTDHGQTPFEMKYDDDREQLGGIYEWLTERLGAHRLPSDPPHVAIMVLPLSKIPGEAGISFDTLHTGLRKGAQYPTADWLIMLRYPSAL
eukprot:Clim_evm12s211 gene=Clim_evmTU12s211